MNTTTWFIGWINDFDIPINKINPFPFFLEKINTFGPREKKYNMYFLMMKKRNTLVESGNWNKYLMYFDNVWPHLETPVYPEMSFPLLLLYGCRYRHPSSMTDLYCVSGYHIHYPPVVFPAVPVAACRQYFQSVRERATVRVQLEHLPLILSQLEAHRRLIPRQDRQRQVIAQQKQLIMTHARLLIFVWVAIVTEH